jgi:hypothetical protein
MGPGGKIQFLHTLSKYLPKFANIFRPFCDPQAQMPMDIVRGASSAETHLGMRGPKNRKNCISASCFTVALVHSA